jgi:1-deoxy-D-xylulose-5-phosphate reductoisomerase
LFNVPPAKVEVIVHPQSTIHSFVEFIDGSILAQFSVTDMRLPILYALTYPERIQSDMRFDMGNLRHLDFCPPDMNKFPCLRLAYEAAEAGGARTVALNAADEVAVAAFLAGRIGFDEIPRIIEAAVSASNSGSLGSIAEVLEADAEARRYAEQRVLESKRKARPRATSVV